ncbi:MAG TPA: DHA2 family efflux MFS transporter permease subunit [Acidimicrobiales bacterium]|nr:DHA2 family efflux MFS transporter permease subunit [Acidimicrobiales bacterium]
MAGSVSMVVIDQTIVSLALPSIQRSLNMTETQMLWVINAYVLAMASLVAIGGRLGDLFGRTTLFRIGALAFVGGSALAGVATAAWWIIGARVIEGAGAAIMLPASSAIIVGSVSTQERGRAFGISTGISMAVLAVGPLLGGFLTQVISWRAVFFVNVPIGLAVIATTFVAVPTFKGDRGTRIDWLGTGLLVPGIVAVIVGLMQGAVWGWGSPQLIIMVIAGVVLLVVFVVVEIRQDHPLVDLRLFRIRNFTGDSAVRALLQFSIVGMLALSSLWVQDVLDFHPVSAGLSLLPLTVPLVFIAPLAGRLYDRMGPRLLTSAGAASFGLALLWMAAVLSKQSYAWIIPAYLAIGVGIGFVMVPITTDALNVVPSARHGQASGVFATMSEMGGALGLAILGAIVAVEQEARIDAFLRGAGVSRTDVPGIERFLAESMKGRPVQTPHGLPPNTFQASASALTSATSKAYYIAGVVMLAAATIAWVSLRRVHVGDHEVHPVLSP